MLSGKALRQILDAENISQVKLASMLGFTNPHINAMIRCKRKISEPTYRRLITYFPYMENRIDGYNMEEMDIAYVSKNR